VIKDKKFTFTFQGAVEVAGLGTYLRPVHRTVPEKSELGHDEKTFEKQLSEPELKLT
jgi:hypothetical protein